MEKIMATLEINIDTINYYDNGCIESILNFKDCMFHGRCIFYYRNGKIESISNHRNGKQHGESKGYYENGKIKLESHFKEDRPIDL